MSQTPQIVLFDIDKTLFNTPEAIKALLDEVDLFLKNQGISRFNAEMLLDEYLQTLEKTSQFHFQRLFDFIVAKLLKAGIKEKETQCLRDRLNQHIESDFLYPDVFPTVVSLKNLGFKLGLFSQNDNAKQQLHKVRQLLKFLDQELIYISRDKTHPNLLKKLPQAAVIIDDKPEVVQALLDFAKHHGRKWRLFLIDRHDLVEKHTRDSLTAQGVKVVNNLDELGLTLGKKEEKIV